MSDLGPFIWGTADILRGTYKAFQYGNVILPMTILRRLDCLLEQHKDEVVVPWLRSTKTLQTC